jgi:2-succinyl-5-enolpyruvyl-6-hydroxy-3-cyclohexene-1-carboxylate synthase
VNGIDGQLATAIGIATGMQETLYCILGDITTLYDLTSLREMPKNLKVVIMNNKGGRIFDMLKLDKRIVLEHEFHFASICQAFGLSYAQKQVELLSDVQVLELFPDRHESESLLKEWSL